MIQSAPTSVRVLSVGPEPLLPDAPRLVNPVEEVTEAADYRHVRLQTIGTTRARLGIVQPLPVRRFVLEDDEV